MVAKVAVAELVIARLEIARLEIARLVISKVSYLEGGDRGGGVRNGVDRDDVDREIVALVRDFSFTDVCLQTPQRCAQGPLGVETVRCSTSDSGKQEHAEVGFVG